MTKKKRNRNDVSAMEKEGLVRNFLCTEFKGTSDNWHILRALMYASLAGCGETWTAREICAAIFMNAYT